MGIPRQYSLDLPSRCMTLIEKLLPAAAEVRVHGEEELGPIATTFLLALSTPMIVLPIERVERHVNAAQEGYADESAFSPHFTAAVCETLGNQKLSKADLYTPAWKFLSVPYEPGLNFARYFPPDVAAALASDESSARASKMCGSQWASCLRNALSHGGIIYLDEFGSYAPGSPTEMLAFVSRKYHRKSRALVQLNVLRIGREDYLEFLRRWADWMDRSGVGAALAA